MTGCCFSPTLTVRVHSAESPAVSTAEGSSGWSTVLSGFDFVCLATSSALLIPEDKLVPKGVKTSSVVLTIPSAMVAISRYARMSENMASK